MAKAGAEGSVTINRPLYKKIKYTLMLQCILKFSIITRTHTFISSMVTNLNFVQECSCLVRLPYVTFLNSLFKPFSLLRFSRWGWLIYKYVSVSSDKTIPIFLWEEFHIYLC
jgi:hypothetical protein